MSPLVVSLPPEIARRLEVLAADMGSSVEECARLALTEFVESWEDHLRTVGEMEDVGNRPDFGMPQMGAVAE
jgi:plasmid stability protein